MTSGRLVERQLIPFVHCTHTVSAKKEMYGPGCGYHVFTGKDASCALGKSSLKPEDAHADYSTLTEEEKKVLDDWYKYFAKVSSLSGMCGRQLRSRDEDEWSSTPKRALTFLYPSRGTTSLAR